MDEDEWLACTDPRTMLVFLEGKASIRKARLYACGLGRSLLPYLGDKRSRQVVDVAEQFADGLATETDLISAEAAASEAIRGTASRVCSWVGDRGPWQAARMIVVSLQMAETQHDAKDWAGKTVRQSIIFLRCVFGNPFRPVTIDTAWLRWNHGTVPAIARRIYEDRAFHDLPILADALEDAGCTDAAILDHCRQPGEHVRGCWVVDLMLGKS